MDLGTAVEAAGGTGDILEALKVAGLITVRAVANLQVDPAVQMAAADFTTAIVNLQALAGRP